ncbi:MAG TPA: lytic transglycosylase domain-containing protein, partial [Actinomycetota bacterium]|nr:lytic transglycosylase domain-containing protein [Actinomycetota bacterium]
PAETPAPDPFEAARRLDAASAQELASRLAEAEDTIRTASSDPDRLERAGRVQQASYRQLVRTPGWREEAFAALPPDVRVHARLNVEAGEALRRLLPSPLRDAPPDAWTIVQPPPPDELRSHYERASEATGIGWEYLAAIHLSETRMGRIRGDSHAGARGPMQFMPATWERYGDGGDIEDYGDAIAAAARMLRANGGPSDMDNALFRYNPSRHYVTAIGAYARVMREAPRTFYGYYHWQVYYATSRGEALLEVGYGT